ncbi:hypothetical protein UJ101_01298 [Flavobacteriaceae bacterium UJ101]|nr:hypothetical protein UJ101_01298 [Flavobacteriaceae bacterium UJ101]
MKYGFALSIISICCTCLLNAQIRITSSDVSGYNSASDGDFYITTDTDELYVGLETGSLRKISSPNEITTLSDNNDGTITYKNESNTSSTITKSSLTDNTDGTYTFSNATGTSDDVQLNLNFPKYISINEYVRNEPVLEQAGRIMFSVHNEFAGYKTDKMICSIYKLGNSTSLTITPVLRRGNVDTSISESVSFNPSTLYSGSSSGGSGTILQAGDIILLNITTPTSFSDAAEGLTCTIKLFK